MTEKKYLWGISPLNEFTNRVIAEELAKTCDAEIQIICDADDNEVSLYVVEHSFITNISKMTTPGISFQAYSKIGGSPWRVWEIYKKRTPAKKTREAIEMVKKDGGNNGQE